MPRVPAQALRALETEWNVTCTSISLAEENGEEVAEDNDGYDLLSFAPSGELKSGEHQKVDVETRNASFRVKTREGYVAGDEYPYGAAPGGSPSR